MGWIDRDAVLHAVDLRGLATEICGPPRGRGRSAKWTCPDPAHPDEHPSMGIFQAAGGYDRWKCLSCGQGGTAIDLLVLTAGVTVGQALADLATRTGHQATLGPSRASDRRPPSPPVSPAELVAATPHPAIAAFVADAEKRLWEPIGGGARAHLGARGFREELLRANRVGFDPGPRHLPRPDGLPRRGPGIVYPVLDPATGQPAYYQVRYLDPARAGRKYDQPTAALAANPLIAEIRPTAVGSTGYVVVCEGVPDGLTAVHAGLTAVAVLGAGAASADTVADRLLARFPDAMFTICLDRDTRPGQRQAGQVAADRLAQRLCVAAVVARILPASPHNDLNDWWIGNGPAAAEQLHATASLLAGLRGPSPPDPMQV